MTRLAAFLDETIPSIPSFTLSPLPQLRIIQMPCIINSRLAGFY